MPWIEAVRQANWSQAICVSLGAYLLGCFATGYYLVRARTGQDLRQLGSGNVGARNVSRILGRPGFLLTVLGDFAKGALAVWLTRYFTDDARLAALALLAVVAGHIWPLQLRFHGGKGAATSVGALALYDFRLALAYAALFGAGWVITRKTVLPGLFAFCGLPVVAGCLQRGTCEVMGVSLLTLMVLFAHRKNIVSETSQLLKRESIQPPENRPIS